MIEFCVSPFIFRQDMQSCWEQANVLPVLLHWKKRAKCVLITVHARDLTTDEHDATRTDRTFHSVASGKFCDQCKFHSRHPDYTIRSRKYLLLDSTKTHEEKGCLAQRCKDDIVSLLTLNNKFKPTIVRTIIENKLNVSLNEKERNQMRGFVTRKNELLRDICEENTISGIVAFVNNNQWYGCLDDDGACEENCDMSPDRIRFCSHPKMCYDTSNAILACQNGHLFVCMKCAWLNLWPPLK